MLSFKKSRNVSVNQKWIDDFQQLAKGQGLSCVRLPYPDVDSFGEIEYDIKKDISPLEWYALIKYSQGYVGNNMHPIVVSLHNAVPFFSFDNYGIKIENGKPTNGESSKVYQILRVAKMEKNRVFANSVNYCPPASDDVFDCIRKFDREKVTAFSEEYLIKYQSMMEAAFNAIENNVK